MQLSERNNYQGKAFVVTERYVAMPKDLADKTAVKQI